MKTVSKRALLQRINRKLIREGEQLCKEHRGNRELAGYQDVGDYYVIDCSLNAVITKHVDIEDLGRELGVLRQGESVAA